MIKNDNNKNKSESQNNNETFTEASNETEKETLDTTDTESTLESKNNIEIEWMDYSNYKEYNQLFQPFEHGVSILDLIFNEGPNARSYLKY